MENEIVLITCFWKNGILEDNIDFEYLIRDAEISKGIYNFHNHITIIMEDNVEENKEYDSIIIYYESDIYFPS